MTADDCKDIAEYDKLQNCQYELQRSLAPCQHCVEFAFQGADVPKLHEKDIGARLVRQAKTLPEKHPACGAGTALHQIPPRIGRSIVSAVGPQMRTPIASEMDMIATLIEGHKHTECWYAGKRG